MKYIRKKYSTVINLEDYMIRFLFNFVIFGVLFYAIYLLFPDAFKTLVSWADSLYGIIRDLGLWVYSRLQDFRKEHVAPLEAPKALLLPLFYLIKTR